MNLNGIGDRLIKQTDDLFVQLVTNLLEESSADFSYSVDDLDKNVNEEETLLEYIRDSEKEFGLPAHDVFSLDSCELTKYVMLLDNMWAFSDESL